MRTGRLDRAEPLADLTRTRWGKIMRTLRLPLCGTFFVLLGAVTTGVAQSEAPGDTPEPAFYACTSFDHGGVVDEGTTTPSEAGFEVRDYVGRFRAVSDDPRAAGDGVYAHNQDSYDGTPWGMGPRWGSSSMENEVGGWEGTYLGAMVPTESGGFVYVIVGRYRGTGGYEVASARSTSRSTRTGLAGQAIARASSTRVRCLPTTTSPRPSSSCTAPSRLPAAPAGPSREGGTLVVSVDCSRSAAMRRCVRVHDLRLLNNLVSNGRHTG